MTQVPIILTVALQDNSSTFTFPPCTDPDQIQAKLNEFSFPGEFNCLALIKKSGTICVFFFDDSSRICAVKTLGRLAVDSQTDFTWHDAQALYENIRSARKYEKPLNASHIIDLITTAIVTTNSAEPIT